MNLKKKKTKKKHIYAPMHLSFFSSGGGGGLQGELNNKIILIPGN